jgi:carbohydrate-binding DOMON domain-containing protein
MSEPHRAAEVVRLFEDTVRKLKAERGDDDPLAIAEAAFAAVHARYPDLSAAETERMAQIRQFNAYSSLFETAHHRAPNTIEELHRWLATPEGRAAYQRAGRTS